MSDTPYWFSPSASQSADELAYAIADRDHYHAMADWLAEMISKTTGVDIGERTSSNLPWCNALDAAEEWIATLPAAQPATGDIRALKHRIHELEGEVLGYKQMLDLAEEKLKPVPSKQLDLFEFWWAEYMPDATQSAAWAAWINAIKSAGVGVKAKGGDHGAH